MESTFGMTDTLDGLATGYTAQKEISETLKPQWQRETKHAERLESWLKG